jgi:DNA polymerase
VIDPDLWQTTLPFANSFGPKNARIAIVGDVWGQQETLAQVPFIGSGGQELSRMLKEVEIERGGCFLTTVLPLQPERGDVETLCVNKAASVASGKVYPMPPLRMGKYVHPNLLGEVQRLKEELVALQPNLIIAVGQLASWALLFSPAISAIRGTIAPCVLVPGLKVLPTYHPSAVLRNWSLRTIVLMDLLKAKRESLFPEIRRPERLVTVNPHLADIGEWVKRALTDPPDALATDIETFRKQITMIGFARSASDAIVIPFIAEGKRGHHYWDNPHDEITAWGYARTLLESKIEKIFQNGVYDIGYLMRLGLKVNAAYRDTMLQHHAMYPELQKGLGFLGSIYTNESSWKLMRHRSSDAIVKADE